MYCIVFALVFLVCPGRRVNLRRNCHGEDHRKLDGIGDLTASGKTYPAKTGALAKLLLASSYVAPYRHVARVLIKHAYSGPLSESRSTPRRHIAPQMWLGRFSDGSIRAMMLMVALTYCWSIVVRTSALTLRATRQRFRSTSDQARKKLKLPTLEQFATDLTLKAEYGKLDPVVGREKEIQHAVEILARRRKNNPLLIGDPGVGKTAIVEGLAQRIVDGKVPKFLQGKRVYLLDIAKVLAGTRYRGDFEKRLTRIINEVVGAEREIILVIDEIHNIVGAGKTVEATVDAGNIMKPQLANGELQVIGATTTDEYRKYIEKDKALERRFQPIDIPEPSVDETIEILKGIVYKYEDYHNVTYAQEAIEACALLSSRYIQDRFLPDKAIDVLDNTGAHVKVMADEWFQEQAGNGSRTNLKVEELEKCEQLLAKIESLENNLQQGVQTKSETKTIVSETNVSDVVSKVTGIPVSKVASSESVRLMELESTLKERVIGQDDAVTAVAKALRRARSGLKDPNRPTASFIFAGPTGVGKTELCKALSNTYYGNERAMIRLDMSEYMEKHTASKIIGSPPGYIGYDEDSQLCDQIRRNPHSLVLFDEIEKAHPDILNLMLQILEDGRLTDSTGRVISFKNNLIAMTTNVGAESIEKTIDGGRFGFQTVSRSEDATYDELKRTLLDEMKQRFRPEFINRLDDAIVFRPLSKESVQKIADLEFNKVFARVAERYNATVELTNEFKEKVLEESYDSKFGARPLRRVVSKLLEDELSSFVLSQALEDGDVLVVDVDDNGRIVINRYQKKW